MLKNIRLLKKPGSKRVEVAISTQILMFMQLAAAQEVFW